MLALKFQQQLGRSITILPLSGGGVQVTKQLICGHSFWVDVIPHWFHLHVCVSSMEGL